MIRSGTGNWGLTKAPENGFTYGGTSVSIYSGSEHKDAAWDYVQDVYCTGDGVKEAYEQFGFMTGFTAPYEDENSYLLHRRRNSTMSSSVDRNWQITLSTISRSTP